MRILMSVAHGAPSPAGEHEFQAPAVAVSEIVHTAFYNRRGDRILNGNRLATARQGVLALAQHPAFSIVRRAIRPSGPAGSAIVGRRRASRSSSTAAARPARTASNNGVSSRLSAASSSAPAFTSTLMVSRKPACAARCRAVLPLWSRTSTRAPRASRSATSVAESGRL